ncbi:MAG TPA: PAS domain S-box protein, partial [Methylomirabilota bacterium]|nr:PAS domain S-box protein [Methylomirabilota bacterium]
SPAYETMWGRTCQSLYDKPLSFAEAIHPEDRPRVFLELEGLREGREYRSEYRIIRPDGSTRWVSDLGFPIRNEAGEVYRSAGIARDITEQKGARRRLELQGKRSALAAEIGITLAQPVPQPEMVNACCSLFTKALGIEAARIWVLNPAEQMLELQGEASAVVLKDAVMLPLNGPGMGEILRGRQPYFSDCLQETWANEQVMAGPQQIRSLAAYPLIAGDIQVGVLALLSNRAMVDDLQGLTAIANHIALGILRRQTNEEREKIFALVENSTDFIAMAGLDGRPSYLNPAGARLIGLPPGADVSAAPLSGYLDPDSWAEVRDQVLPTTLKTGRWEGDTRLRHLQTGEPIEVHTHSFLVRHPRSGAPLCIATIQRDITERKQRERELHRVEDERDRFFTLSMDLFCIAGFDGKFRRVNPACEQALGFSAEELMASPFIDFIHPEDRAATLVEMQKLVEGQNRTHFEIRSRCKDGSYRWVSWCATPLVQEGVFFAYGRDLTERKASEEKVRRTEELYRRAIAGAGAVPYSYDYKTRAYVFMGEGIEQLIGYPAREVTPALWQSITQENVMAGETAGLDKAEAARRIEAGLIRNWRCDMRVITHDGQARWLSDASVQTLDENGKPIGSMGILQDISDRKEVEEALAQGNRLSTLGAEVGIALTRQENLNTMLNRCSEAIVKYAGAAFARIWTLNDRDSMLELQASAGMYTHVDGEHSRIPVGKFKIGLIAQERVPHLTNFVIGDPRVGNQEWAKREGMVAFAGYPLIVAQRVVGVLGMFARQPLSQGVLQELASISDAIALGIVRKQVEDERERFFALVENNGDFVGMSTLDGHPFYLNPAGARLAGLDDPEKVGSTHLQDYYDPANWSTIHDVALPAMMRDGHWEGELQLKHLKTGELIDVHRRSFVVRRPQTGEAMCWATVQRDITERKRAEESLRLLSSAIEQSADNVIITGRNGVIKYANPAFLELNGMSREEVL